MNQDRTRREELNRVTEQIIGGAFTVSNELGSGFLEKAQCLNYLKATDLRVCLLLNFGRPRVEVKRIVHDF